MMETRDKDQVFYHYNREERLAKASPAAQFMVDHYGAKRPGLIRSLTATRSLAFLFFLVLFASVAVFVAFMLQSTRNSGSVAGNKLTVKAMWFDGQVYVTVKRNKPRFSSSAVTLELKAAVGESTSVGLMQAGEAEYRTSLASPKKTSTVLVMAAVAQESDTDERGITLVAPVE